MPKRKKWPKTLSSQKERKNLYSAQQIIEASGITYYCFYKFIEKKMFPKPSKSLGTTRLYYTEEDKDKIMDVILLYYYPPIIDQGYGI